MGLEVSETLGFPFCSISENLTCSHTKPSRAKNWETLPPSLEKDRFEWDYINWPAEYGAPFEDVNRDGIFTQGIDRPKYVGDETLFYVNNDLDSAASLYMYGSPPVGIEVHTTVWGHASPISPVRDAVYKLYQLVNKSDKIIENMYFAYWTDDDLGWILDDYSGSDPDLMMGYTYNGDGNDDIYGSNVPAIAHMFIQTPITPSADNDSAFFKGRWLKGYKNLPMTSFMVYISGTIYTFPALGDYENGSLGIYNNLKGLLANGDPIIDPTTNDTTTIMLDGDPNTGTGWYEGAGWLGGPPQGDRIYIMSTGPFTFAPGDTQEVAIAIYMAAGSSNIGNITNLKNGAEIIRNQYLGSVTNIEDFNNDIPKRYNLLQNYPNPFNPSTKIKYSLPPSKDGFTYDNVKLVVYDILGREVATLVNQEQKPGTYEVNFNASKLASGVYYYTLIAGNYVSTKKMMLIK